MDEEGNPLREERERGAVEGALMNTREVRRAVILDEEEGGGGRKEGKGR